MKKLFNISVGSLLILAALSFSDASQVAAQGNSHKKQQGYNSDKGGPPDWAPAHGYRRKGGEDDEKEHKHKNKHNKGRKNKSKASDYERREEELNRREAELKRREEALKRREKGDRDDEVIHKRRPEDIIKKRRDAEEKEKGGIFKKPLPKDDRTAEEIEIERKKEEIRKKMPTIFRKGKSAETVDKTGTNTSGDWTGGSGW